MERIDIKVTFKCNNACKFCVQGEKRKIHCDKETKEIKTILDDSRNNYGEVVFTGGEPTLRKDIIDLVSYAKSLGYRVQIQTNGRMFMYQDFCKRMGYAGIEVAAISIHGHTAKLHDHLTGARGSFQQSTTGIKNLLHLGIPVVTNTVINKFNYRYLPNVAEFLIDLGINQYQLSFPHILGNAFANLAWMIPRKKEVVPYVKKAIEFGIKKKATPKVEAIPYCFLKEYGFCLTDKDIPETKVFDVQINNNFNLWRKEKGKVKGPVCKACKYFECCEGPWREYPEIFGWSEFKPLKKIF